MVGSTPPKAFQLREHASDRERLADRLGLLPSCNPGNWTRQAQTFQEWIERAIREILGAFIFVLSTMYGAEGQYEKAAKLVREHFEADDLGWYPGSRLDPLWPCKHLDEARQTLRQAQTRKLDRRNSTRTTFMG